ncbi:phage holin family protein [Bogoriella caseilytica]|uniref:Putative superfamily III holin-X n=1 Tax=Bogoriella caseilytica TaxID=56055 RepID=A0A3N2BB96_9MICO|nr:phage holin family protein [Bogoriella caseilytica]ROR72536.1 putative superfamily III holin-X [Bogoriella caseilytica]
MTTSPQGSPPPQRERTFGELLSDLSAQVTNLIKAEIALAIAQAKAKGQRMGMGIGLFAGAGVLALYLLGVLLAAAILVLAIWLPAWASALIVAGVLLLIIGVLALIGRAQLKASKQYEITLQEDLKDDVEAVKKGLQ